MQNFVVVKRKLQISITSDDWWYCNGFYLMKVRDKYGNSTK